MKTCMLAHFGWVVEGEIQADPIKELFLEALSSDGDDSAVDVRMHKENYEHHNFNCKNYIMVQVCIARGDELTIDNIEDFVVRLLTGEISAEEEAGKYRVY